MLETPIKKEIVDGLVAEQPDAYIRQVEMILLQLAKGLDGRFLEHLLQD